METHAATPSPSPSAASPLSTSSLLPSSSRGVLFLSGLVSGVSVSGLFNPYDRALYLSVVHDRPFLCRDNFTSPYNGFSQSLFHRTLSSGIYFPLFDLFKPSIASWLQSPHLSAHQESIITHFLAGNLAGAVSGVMLNQLTAIKYASWDNNFGFFRTAQHMWQEGGFRPFFKGIMPTVMRDTIFGGSFAAFKYFIQSHSHHSMSSDFMASLLAGLAGTILSSPMNYVRNIKYAWKASEQPPSSVAIIRQLYQDSKSSDAPWPFVQSKLRIGWGTLRVALGMAFGYQIYESVKEILEEKRIKRKMAKGKIAASAKISTS